jgi:murein endopeptidase
MHTNEVDEVVNAINSNMLVVEGCDFAQQVRISIADGADDALFEWFHQRCPPQSRSEVVLDDGDVIVCTIYYHSRRYEYYVSQVLAKLIKKFSVGEVRSRITMFVVGDCELPVGDLYAQC